MEVPAKFKSLVTEIEKLNVLELSELVKVLEEKFGVSASMPMMPAMSSASAGGAAEETAKEEKTSFSVELRVTGDQKIAVIKVLREAIGLGLKEAKDLADAAPKLVKEGLEKAAAEDLKKKLEGVGATVEIK